MKRIILTAFVLSLTFISCAGNKEEVEKESNVMAAEPQAQSTEVPNATPANAEAQGLELISGSDCMSCHQADAKLIGPSYQDIAAEYSEKDIDLLAQKIIEGGQGNWGEIPMAPHVGLSKDDAQKMVKYILSQKK